MQSDSKIKKSFGSNVRNLRHRAKLSQEDLADLCGLDRTYIGSVERGERNIGLINIVTLAVALQASPQELISF